MKYLLGIDLGTSSVKSLLLSEKGDVKGISQQEYTFDIPQEGWAEQNPDTWWDATVSTIRGVLKESAIDPAQIEGIGFSGQMHGMVILGEDEKPLRNAIIWNDQRSIKQVKQIEQIIKANNFQDVTFNQIATGFQTASLLWVKENEPDLYEKIHKVILPKDYIRYRLTGTLSTDVTDAASTLALNVKTGQWSEEIITKLGLNMEIYPTIHLPDELAGTITAQAEAITGLKKDTKVVHGGADQVMQAVGNGIISEGQMSATIGTGGQIFAPLSEPVYDSELRSHTFSNFKSDSWYFLGATLSAGLSLKWLRDNVLDGMSYAEMSKQVQAIPPGSEGLIFLPYMGGERTPHMDPYARGMLFGLTLKHTKVHIMRAIMEGVVFSLKDCLSILQDLGKDCDQVIASGGGARSEPWLQIQADILNKPIYISQMKEQAAVGAAIMAGCGTGIFTDVNEASETVIKWEETPYLPDPDNVKKYEEYYNVFKELYVSNKENMKVCAELSNN